MQKVPSNCLVLSCPGDEEWEAYDKITYSVCGRNKSTFVKRDGDFLGFIPKLLEKGKVIGRELTCITRDGC